jgi:hypothetical protein
VPAIWQALFAAGSVARLLAGFLTCLLRVWTASSLAGWQDKMSALLPDGQYANEQRDYLAT